MELVEFRGRLENVFLRLWDHATLQFLQTYYSQVLGFQVLINPYAAEIAGSVEVLLLFLQ